MTRSDEGVAYQKLAWALLTPEALCGGVLQLEAAISARAVPCVECLDRAQCACDTCESPLTVVGEENRQNGGMGGRHAATTQGFTLVGLSHWILVLPPQDGRFIEAEQALQRLAPHIDLL